MNPNDNRTTQAKIADILAWAASHGRIVRSIDKQQSAGRLHELNAHEFNYHEFNYHEFSSADLVTPEPPACWPKEWRSGGPK